MTDDHFIGHIHSLELIVKELKMVVKKYLMPIHFVQNAVGFLKILRKKFDQLYKAR